MNPRLFHSGKVQLYAGDCMEVLRDLPNNSIDAVVTDPPYGLKFRGRDWDRSENIAFTPELWLEVLRVLKPGGHMVCFGGTRTYHRMACAIEDAGFEIRDQIGWTYGSGFPKSYNIGNGWGTALKPAWEPICLARKPLSKDTVAANVLRWGTGAINVDGCRVAPSDGYADNAVTQGINTAQTSYAPAAARRTFELSQLGRFPANLIHDGSPEVLAGFPKSNTSRTEVTSKPGQVYGGGAGLPSHTGVYGFDEKGSTARFFYTAKADADDRLNSKHPTVKPVDLIAWLVRLICPKNGTVLDPFAGTGTTGAATFREGCRAVLIEREAEYLADIERRMELLLSGPDERARNLAKADPYESLPLFSVE